MAGCARGPQGWSMREQFCRGYMRCRPDGCQVASCCFRSLLHALAHLLPCLCSGDQEGNILIWDVQSAESGTDGKKALSPVQRLVTNLDVMTPDSADSLKGDKGHTNTVEAVKFQPQSSQELCSAGDDKSIRLWDLRTPGAPVASTFNEKENDFHCVDWSAFDLNSLLAGDSHGIVYLYDRRKASCYPSPPLGLIL
eukprot:763170-Hanusia_phi.AAC.4